jgi:hypothetical protein
MHMNKALTGMWRLTVRVRVTLFVVRGHKLVYVLWKMPLQLKLILMTNLFSPQKPFGTCEKRSACMNNVLSFSIDWFFLAHSRPYHLISPDIRMTDWKDSYDSWKDSRLPRQLIAVLFSWKSLSHQSTGSWYKFFNCKMLRPARLTQLAGSTPQRQFKLAATILRWWSKRCLQINVFIFFCPSKALHIKTTKRQFPPDSFLHLLTERYIRFWKELRIHWLLHLHILSYKSKMLYGIVSNLAGITPQSRFSSRLHHLSMVFPDLHFTKWIFFLPQGFYSRTSQFSWQKHSCHVQTQFSIFFFALGKLNFENGSVKFQVSVFFFVIHIFTNNEQNSSRHVTLNYSGKDHTLSSERGHLFVYIVENDT